MGRNRERVCHGEFRIQTRCFPFQEAWMTYQRRVLKTMETVDKTRTRFIPLNSSTSDGKYNCGMRVAEWKRRTNIVSPRSPQKCSTNYICACANTCFTLVVTHSQWRHWRLSLANRLAHRGPAVVLATEGGRYAWEQNGRRRWTRQENSLVEEALEPLRLKQDAERTKARF